MNLSSRYVTIMIITLPAPTLSLAIPLPALRELCLFSGEHWVSSPSPLAFMYTAGHSPALHHQEGENRNGTQIH